jgi:hypothetical protein
MPENWNFSHREISNGNLIIRSVETLLSSNESSANTSAVLEDHGLTVFTDILSINGPLRLPGQNVFIHARQINCGPRAAIDVSGAAGEGFGSKPQPPSFNPGTGGADGAGGSRGMNGGTITIFCERVTGPLLLTARGGNGGRGQDGGDGVAGAVGPTGGDGSFGFTMGQSGGAGGRGGNAGRAGPGGPGGDSGTIQVRTINTQQPQITFDLAGGRGGQPGTHGIPGMGGPGGAGGRNGRIRRMGSLRDGEDVFVFDGTRAATGPTGPSSNTSPTPANEGGTGASKPENQGMNLNVVGDAEVGSFASMTQMLMLQHKLELDYLNSAFVETMRSLSWIERLTRGPVGTNVPPSIRNTVMPSTSEWNALRNRAISLILQLQAGLDYYGHPRNFVPLVDVGSYENTFQRLSGIAQAVQAQTRLFRESLRNNLRDVSVIDQSISLARESMTALEVENNAIRTTQIPQARSAVDQLLEALQDQQAALVASEQDFQDAVQREANNCDFLDVIKFVAAVVPIVEGAIGNVRSIVSSVETFSSSAHTLRDVVSSIRVVAGQLGEIRDAYNSVRDRLATLNSDTKLVMLDRDFEETIKPFLNLPEAQSLRQLMRSYIDTARARNEKIMDLTSLELRAHDLDSQIAQRREEVSRLNAVRIVTQDLSLADYVTFVENQLVRAKQDLIKILYLVHRALDYWSLRLTDFSVLSDQTVEDLIAVYGRLLLAETLAATDRNRADQSFGPNRMGGPQEEPIRFSLTRDDLPEEFERFRRTGKLVFTIPDDHRAFQLGFAAITVRDVDIHVPGVQINSTSLSIRITHSGDAGFRDTQDRRINFSHNPRFTIVTRDVASDNLITEINNNLGGETGRFAFVSPFTTWTVEILDRFNQGQTPNLSQVQRIDLAFSGFFLPFTV